MNVHAGAHNVKTFGSLFAGIGGIDLGLERAGWTCRFQVEWDAFCQRVLAAHWPDVPRYGDITTVDWSGVERVDLLAGGFPCQPVSGAGKKQAQADARWLWPEFARAIRALRPRLVLVENVPNLLAVNGGSAFGDVLGDMAACGYDAEWDCIPAAAVGALHDRDRVFIVAYPISERVRAWGHRQDGGPQGAAEGAPSERQWLRPNPGDGRALAEADSDGQPRARLHQRSGRPGETPPDPHRNGSPMADADGGRREPGRECPSIGGLPEFEPSRGPRDEGTPPDAERGGRNGRTPDAEWGPLGRAVAFQAGATLGRSDYWLTEPEVGRVANGVPARMDRLRSLGNAVVPQVIEVIGRQLLAALESAA